jgi:hypothetical protein
MIRSGGLLEDIVKAIMIEPGGTGRSYLEGRGQGDFSEREFLMQSFSSCCFPDEDIVAV